MLELQPNNVNALEGRGLMLYDLLELNRARADLRRAQEFGSPRAAELMRAKEAKLASVVNDLEELGKRMSGEERERAAPGDGSGEPGTK